MVQFAQYYSNAYPIAEEGQGVRIFLYDFSMYRVIKKEGGKVKGHYTPKTCILVAIKGFIVTTRMGHLIICIKDPKTITFGVNLRLIKFDGKVAKNADFSQKLVIFSISMHIHNYNNRKNEVYIIFK